MLDGVNQRTQLVGKNRLELLLFKLNGSQVYGINVFKIKEVIQCPQLNQIPNSHHLIAGVATLRGKTVSIIDMSKAIGMSETQDIEKSFVIVTEYNRSIQGFIVQSVNRIVNLHWEEILSAPVGAGKNNYLTAITKFDDKLIEIIDVEKVLSIVVGDIDKVSEETKDKIKEFDVAAHILVVDDSSVARNQVARTLDTLNVKCTLACDGKEALDLLLEIKSSGEKVTDHFDMIITDIEMPRMDGYTLTANIKEDLEMQGLYVLLHTSLSGVFNQSMVKKVGANAFVAKFDQDELTNALMEWLADPKRKQAQVA